MHDQQVYVFEGRRLRFLPLHRVPSKAVRPLFKIKMARPENNTIPDHHSGDSEMSPDLSDKFVENPKAKDYDVEGQGRRLSHSRVAVDSSSISESVGRQIEMEAENGIKYRTCSWQKVGNPSR